MKKLNETFKRLTKGLIKENEEGTSVKVYKDKGGATVRVFSDEELFNHLYNNFYLNNDKAVYDDTYGGWEVFYHDTSNDFYKRNEMVLINKEELTIKNKIISQTPLFSPRNEDMTEEQEYKLRSVERRHGWTYQGLDEFGNVIVKGSTDLMKIAPNGKFVD